MHPEHPDRQYPGEDGEVEYREGLFIGYRHVDRAGLTPLFPFGFGLSYTTFDYADLRPSATTIGPDEPLELSIDVTNTGSRRGQEVVQVYVRDSEARLPRPEQELRAFAKVALEPGERRTVTLPLTREPSPTSTIRPGDWVAEAGTFEILVGASSRDIRARASVKLTETRRWPA